MDPEKSKEIKEKEMIAIQKNQEMLQTKNELLKKAEEKRKTVMAQQGGILKSKRVSQHIITLKVLLEIFNLMTRMHCR